MLDRGELAGRRIGPATRGRRWLVDAADVARLKANGGALRPAIGSRFHARHSRVQQEAAEEGAMVCDRR
ncbi:MAG TPA: hypothetical protein VF897_18780 [Roseiflexaceae bacterium]